MNTNPPPLRLAVFDCDGTLVDSQHAIVDAMHAACASFNVPAPDASAVRRVIGLPLVDAIAVLMPDGDHAAWEAMSEAYKSAFRDLRSAGDVHEPLFPGIHNVLSTLDEDGWLLGVATGKARVGLDNTLGPHGLLERFVTLQTADRARGKPHPEMMLNALSETGVEALWAVMIGDTTFDVEMAVNAGVRAIGVDWGYHGADELRDAGAVRVVETAEELMQALAQMMETA